MRPGGDATASLAAALDECGALGTDGDPTTRLGLARGVLESGELGLSEIVGQSRAAEARNLLWISSRNSFVSPRIAIAPPRS